MIVGADGGRSIVRSYLGTPVEGWSYSQMGVVASVRHPVGVHNNAAWQHFLPSGPVALLPVCCLPCGMRYFMLMFIVAPRQLQFHCMVHLSLARGIPPRSR